MKTTKFKIAVGVLILLMASLLIAMFLISKGAFFVIIGLIILSRLLYWCINVLIEGMDE